MAHKVTIDQTDHWTWWARCNCGWTPDPRRTYRTRQMIEDEVAKHDRIVERAKHHLRKSMPSLKVERDYYEEMANNPEVPEADRRLWRQLADGLNSRLGKPGPEQEHPMLFPLET